MPALRWNIRTVDRPNSRVLVSPAPVYDIVDPDDNYNTPSWWRSVVVVDRANSQVHVKMRACRLVLTCLAGENNYILESGTLGVTSVSDLDSTRIGQHIDVDPQLPSTNGVEFEFELVSVTGDARSFYLETSAVAPSGVMYLELYFRLFDIDNTMVPPAVGATYTMDLYFWSIG